jgi:hypothetical protein
MATNRNTGIAKNRETINGLYCPNLPYEMVGENVLYKEENGKAIFLRALTYSEAMGYAPNVLYCKNRPESNKISGIFQKFWRDDHYTIEIGLFQISAEGRLASLPEHGYIELELELVDTSKYFEGVKVKKMKLVEEKTKEIQEKVKREEDEKAAAAAESQRRYKAEWDALSDAEKKAYEDSKPFYEERDSVSDWWGR